MHTTRQGGGEGAGQSAEKRERWRMIQYMGNANASGAGKKYFSFFGG